MPKLRQTKLTPEEVESFLVRIAEHTVDCNLEPELVLGQLHKRILIHALELEGGNQVHAARRLRIHRNTLARNMKQCGVRP